MTETLSYQDGEYKYHISVLFKKFHLKRRHLYRMIKENF